MRVGGCCIAGVHMCEADRFYSMDGFDSAATYTAQGKLPPLGAVVCVMTNFTWVHALPYAVKSTGVGSHQWLVTDSVRYLGCKM